MSVLSLLLQNSILGVVLFSLDVLVLYFVKRSHSEQMTVTADMETLNVLAVAVATAKVTVC